MNSKKSIEIEKLIEDAAFDLIQEKGFFDTSIMEITNKAGIGRTTFYTYFSSKEELFLKIILKEDQYYQAIADSLPAVHSSRIKLQTFLKLFAEYYTKTYDVEYTSSVYSSLNYLRKNDYYYSYKNRPFFQTIVKIISEGQENKEFDSKLAADKIAWMFFDLLNGAVICWSFSNGKYNLEKRLNQITSIFINGFTIANDKEKI